MQSAMLDNPVAFACRRATDTTVCFKTGNIRYAASWVCSLQTDARANYTNSRKLLHSRSFGLKLWIETRVNPIYKSHLRSDRL